MKDRSDRSGPKLLIGLIGSQGSGKDTVAEYLVKQYDFKHISTGDLLRQQVRAQLGTEPNRDQLREYGRSLRSEQGADYLVRNVMIEPSDRLVISGLRAVSEAQMIKERSGLLLACTAPVELRFQRNRERGRVGDDVTLEQFETQEAAEAKNSDPNAQNISALIEMSDHLVDNSGSLNDLYHSIDDWLSCYLRALNK